MMRVNASPRSSVSTGQQARQAPTRTIMSPEMAAIEMAVGNQFSHGKRAHTGRIPRPACLPACVGPVAEVATPARGLCC